MYIYDGYKSDPDPILMNPNLGTGSVSVKKDEILNTIVYMYKVYYVFE